MRPHKRPELFVHAFARARERVPGLTARIAGDGLLLESTSQTAMKLGLGDAVQFVGRVPKLEDLYTGLDLVVSTSEREGFGLVLAGAMAAGLPVVAPKVGGVPELVVDGETGFLVRPDDRDAFAQRIIELANDPALRARMGAVGRERITAHFTLARYCQEMIQVLEAAERGLVTA
jgi:glycosyltransferase involved in cell wall biosynthesis